MYTLYRYGRGVSTALSTTLTSSTCLTTSTNTSIVKWSSGGIRYYCNNDDIKKNSNTTSLRSNRTPIQEININNNGDLNDIRIGRTKRKEKVTKETSRKFYDWAAINNKKEEEDGGSHDIIGSSKDEKIKEKIMRKEETRDSHLERLNQFYIDNKHLIDLESFKMKSKVPIVLLFVYIGTGYHGLEYNPHSDRFPTLENELEKALFKSGTILPSNFGDITRIRWTKSSRTDKGVHSLYTLISVALEVYKNKVLTVEGIKEYVDLINSHLPAGLKVISLANTAKSFDPRRQGSSRTYHYLMPKKYLGDRYSIKEINELVLPIFKGVNSYHNFTSKRNTYIKLDNQNQNVKENQEDGDEMEEEEEDRDGELELNNNNNNRQDKKIDREMEKKSFRKNSKNIRNIIKFEIQEPTFTLKNPETGEQEEWVKFIIQGESFIQYQIRKMIGFVMAIANRHCEMKTLELALKSPFSIRSPIAPPTTLYLYDCVICERKSPNPYTVFPLIPSEELDSDKQEFCMTQLYPHLAQLNHQQNIFNGFIKDELAVHKYGIEEDDQDHLDHLYKEYLNDMNLYQERKNTRFMEKQQQLDT